MTFITWTLIKGRPKDTSYFEGSKAAVIVCDLMKEPTITKMSAWAESIRKGIGKVPLVFVGNNVDEASKNNVEMMNKIAKSYASPVVFTYLEDRDSIEEVFVQIINAVRPNFGEDVFKPEQQDNPPFKHQA